MKNKPNHDILLPQNVKKFFITMKISFLLLVLTVLNANATNIFSQNARVSVDMQNVTVREVVSEIERQGGINFLFNDNLAGLNQRVSVSFADQPIKYILESALSQADMTYEEIKDDFVVLLSKPDYLKQQEISVTGTVTDINNVPLPGVAVVVKGTSIGTTTDIDGMYSLTLPEDAEILVFSFVGMITQEVVIEDREVINVIMEEDILALEELVVVGYGVQRKVNLTGSVEAINAEQIISRPTGQVSMALQGMAPGVTVTQNSGKPGSDHGTIRIRGIGTIGDSNPLILIDGVPGSLNNIDINEVETISVLKDAASASIYGSRAANGVILVTTKRAKDEEIRINYRNMIGWQQPTALMEKVSGYDHMVMMNKAYENMGRSPVFSQGYIDAYRLNAPSDEYPETNWHEVMLKELALQQNHYLSIQGGTESIRLLGSISYLNQDGLMHSNFQRVNVRLNSDVQLMDNLSLKLDLSMVNNINEEPPQHWGFMTRQPHNLAGKNEDGSWGIGWDGGNGWALMEDGGFRDGRNTDILTNIAIDWEALRGLNFQLQLSPNRVFSHNKVFNQHVDLFYPDGIIINPTEFKANLAESYGRRYQNTYRLSLDYSLTFDNHSFNVIAGSELIDFKTESIRGYRERFPLADYSVLNVGSPVNQSATGTGSEWSLISYFGRLNYNYMEKYLLEANFRIDGSSRFAKESRYGFFPSFSAAWRISEESFYSNLLDYVPYMKFRASWGTLGNQNIGIYPYMSSVSLGQNYMFGNQAVIGAALLEGSNPMISWETTEMFNFGIDANIWRFNIVADYYIKNTYDILLQLPIPIIAGLGAPYQNAGLVKNTGWDLRFVYANQLENFTHSIGATLSDVKNEIVDLVGTGPYIFSRTIHKEGYPIGALFGLEAVGLFQNQNEIDNHAVQYGNVQPGDIKYIDQNGDGVINADDRIVIGSTIPRYTFGFDYSLQYKEFDLGIFLQGVGKVDGYLDNYATMAFYLGGTAHEWQKDYWSQDNPDAFYPRLTFNHPNNETGSSYWMRSSAYLRLKNVQIGYTLPRQWTNRVNIGHARIFVSGQNLLTFSDFYHSFDPESPVGTGSHYPMVRVFTFGVETNF